MDIVFGELGKVNAFKYMTTDNHERYRAICKFAYNMAMHSSNDFARSEIYYSIKQDERFEEYTEQQLEEDLNKLIEWGNINVRQSDVDAESIEEFTQKRYRYSCTEETIAIEKNLMEFMRSKKMAQVGFEKNMIVYLEAELEKMANLLKKPPQIKTKEYYKNVFNVWNELEQRSVNLRENTESFLRHVNSKESEELMGNEAFLVYKNKFFEYLTDFITEIRKREETICKYILSIDREFELIFESILEYQRENGIFVNRNIEIDGYMISWNRLKYWFISEGDKNSNFENIVIQTRTTINRILRNVQRLESEISNKISKGKDFANLAKVFFDTEKEEDAIELGAFVFGFDGIKSFSFAPNSTEDNFDKTLKEFDPLVIEVEKNNSRKKAEKKMKATFLDEEAKKEKLNQKRLENQRIRNEFYKTVVDNEIHLENHVFSEETSKLVLDIISESIAETIKQKRPATINTEYGAAKVVQKSENYVSMKCTHGTLKIKDYKIVFINGVE